MKSHAIKGQASRLHIKSINKNLANELSDITYQLKRKEKFGKHVVYERKITLA